MNKTLGYWIEKLFPYLAAIFAIFFSYRNWDNLKFLDEADFFNNIITVSSVLFGFLLAILTLIIQSESKTINEMKKHGSFLRLISLNKIVVISSILNCFYAFFLTLFIDIIKVNLFY